METAPTQHMTLIVLSGALLAALAVAAVVYFVPTINPVAPGGEVDNAQVALQETAPKEFNTSVLQRTEYKDLDASLFTRGLLPVQPPAGTGKTNLFQ